MWYQQQTRRSYHSSGPIITPGALETFRTRELHSFTWMKDIDIEDLNCVTDHVDHNFFIGPKPYTHQLVCFHIGIRFPEFLFFLDPGAGKTKITLDVLKYRQLFSGLKAALVLVPNEVNIFGWMDEIKLHRHDMKVVDLGSGSRLERQAKLLHPADLYLLNYDGLQSFFTNLDKAQGKRVIDAKLVSAFTDRIDALVLDECHLIGNRSSLRFRMCNLLAKKVSVCYGLTGTPFGRNPEKLWSQFYLVDKGATLGETLGLYRMAYFTPKQNYWGGVDYTFNQRYTKLLHTTLNNSSIRYEDKEFIDMPKVVYKKHRVSFGVEAEKYYQGVKDELIKSRKDLAEAKNAFLRMRQLCAGFISLSVEDKDEPEKKKKEKVTARFYTNPKLAELVSLLETLPEDEKVIVYHEFIITGDTLESTLAEKKIKYARVGGSHKSAVSFEKFMVDPNTRVLVANNHSGATTGINPHTVCRRIVFFDSPVDPIVRKQAERRVNRPGQQKHVYIHDLLIANSVDEAILGYIKQGNNLMQAILTGVIPEEFLK